MKENVFDVLMYLFENYYMDDDNPMSPDRESPAAIRVLVYNHAGQLILEEEFEVTHAS